MNTIPRFRRPPLERSAPKRHAAQFYRAASGDEAVVAGLPLDSAEAIAAAAVRLGYKVAQRQIERTANVATRLRQAGDRAAGPNSDRKALDATEQIIFKAIMAGLGWLEGVAAEPGNPIQRMASAEFRLLGSMLGLLPATPAPSPAVASSANATPNDRSSAPPTAATAPGSNLATHRAMVTVKHEGTTRRLVLVDHYDLAPEAAAYSYRLTFFSPAASARSLTGRLRVDRTGAATLTVTTTARTGPGPWKAAICADDGTQLGSIQVSL